MIKHRHLCYCFIIPLLVSCAGSDNKNSAKIDEDVSGCCVLDNVEYVTDFPKNRTLNNPEYIPMDLAGVRDIKVGEDALYLSFMPTESDPNTIHVLDKNQFQIQSSFLAKGNGPGEVLNTPYFSGIIFHEEGSLIGSLAGNSKMLSVDFTESGKTGRTVLSSSCDMPKGFVMNNILLKDGSILYTTTDKKFSRIERILQKDDDRVSSSPLDKLNSASIKTENDGFLFNILGTMFGYNYELDRIMEASIYLNCIHLYNIEGSYEKSVCIGNRVTKIDEVESLGVNEMKQRTMTIRTYKDFFALAFINDDDSIDILRFDWDGRPLERISTGSTFNSFDFDSKEGYLYLLNRDVDSLVRYKIN